MTHEPRFLGNLKLEQRDDIDPSGKTWELLEDLGFLRKDGILVIGEKGATTDGASIPILLQRIIGLPIQDKYAAPATLHDGGYRKNKPVVLIDMNKTCGLDAEVVMAVWRDLPNLMDCQKGCKCDCFIHAETMSRRFWDETFDQGNRVKGVTDWKRRVVFRAVCMFGWKPYEEK